MLVVALLASVGGNLWLAKRVFSWKGRTWQAILLPERRLLTGELPAADVVRDEIWMIGDSRVSMWPRDLLLEGHACRNFGVSGWTTREVADAVSSSLPSPPPALVIVQCGINDIQAGGYEPATARDNLRRAVDHHRRVAEICRKRACPLLILSVLPRGKRDLRDLWFWTSAMDRQVVELNDSLSRLAGDGVYFLDVSSVIADGSGIVRAEYSSDTLHLNEEGYRALAGTTWDACRLLGLLERQGASP